MRSHSGGVSELVARAVSSAHPLILTVALCAILLAPGRALQWAFGGGIVWSLLLGTLIASRYPQLEFDRFGILPALLLIPLVSLLLERTLQSPERILIPGNLILLGLCCTSVGVAMSATQGRSLAPLYSYTEKGDEVRQLVQSYRGSGRVALLGFALHQFDNGHFAPLPLLTDNTPMVASFPFHSTWKFTELIPDTITKQGPTAIEGFLDDYNVSSIITLQRRWTEYCQRHPERYEQIPTSHTKLKFFRRVPPTTGYVAAGGATVTHTLDTITFTPTTTEVDLRFSYLPFLQIRGCASIVPVSSPYGYQYIGARGCTVGSEATITAPPTMLQRTWYEVQQLGVMGKR